MLKVQQYLNSKSFKDLSDSHGVYGSLSSCKKKVSLNYDMVEVKNDDLLASECRGLIIAKQDGSEFPHDEKGKLDEYYSPGETVIIAYPFDRFFNYGQDNVNVDFSKGVKVQEKMDGTLIIVNWDFVNGDWCVATRSSPDADIIGTNGLTFRVLLERALLEEYKVSFDQFSSRLDQTVTYCFELTTPLNRIVVNYSNFELTLLGARDLKSGIEIDICDDILDIGIKRVKEFDFSDVDSLVAWVNTLKPLESEGVVVRQQALDAGAKSYNRFKVKSEAYCNLHRFTGNVVSDRQLLLCILHGNDDDARLVLSAYATNRMDEIKSQLVEICKKHDALVLELQSKTNSKKEFALAIRDLEKVGVVVWDAILYQINSGKVRSTKDFVAKNKKDHTWHSNFLDGMLGLMK